MKKILSTVLALVMVCACLPTTAIGDGDGKTQTNQLISGDTMIKLDEQNIIKNASPENIKSASTVRHDSIAEGIVSDYTADELRAMSTDELIENTRDSLPKGFSDLADRSDEYGKLNDPETSDNAIVKKLMANKAESKAKMQQSIEYGEKLASGEITATKANHDSKYIVVDDTILITNEDELRGIAGQSGYFRLACDIKLTAPWEPIDFYGTLEGAGYTISAATMQYGEYDYVGFFSELGETAVVQNLNFDYPYVYANSNAGAICAYNKGVINNCHVIGGVVAGYMWASFDEAFWTISAYNMGGICGLNEGYIMNCSYEGDVDGWKQCGGICGTNAGFVFACYAGGNVAYETNTWDIDYYGAEYTYYTYGEASYLPFSTMLRDMWAAYMLLYNECTAYGHNGGLVGENYYAIFDSCVQGSGSGSNYNLGVVGGLDCMGGLVGADAGQVSHCYSIDRAFPVPSNGGVIYCAWDYGDAGEGIYYDYEYFLAHKGIAMNYAEITAESDQVFYYGNPGLPCEDGAFHGTELTAEQFYTASTFASWNHAEWNNGDVWLIEDGYIPTFLECLIFPEEYVIRYEVANANGLLDGDVVAYKLAHHDSQYNYTEPVPPTATSNISGYGVVNWYPDTPQSGKAIYGDKVYKAYFGQTGGSTEPTPPSHLPQNLIGDVNLDKKVNTADAVYLLKAIASDSIGQFTSEQSKNADTNYDNQINTADASRILQYCAGIIIRF